MINFFRILLISYLLFLFSCKNDDLYTDPPPYPATMETFGNKIDLEALENYANQAIPNYITKDNTTSNPITDKGATLGRVLFYDKNLSKDNTVSCSNCHLQRSAFSDNNRASIGIAGTTGRHSMRLINTRFAEESKFFWDESALTLEIQTTRPIQDHIEMGFSGGEGDPSFADLIAKLEAIEYYQELFLFVYGDTKITEDNIQKALAQFIRSIQSFDSKYDTGRSQVMGNFIDFPNYTEQENLGKDLFLRMPELDDTASRIGGGLGCQSCHRAPEFDIVSNSGNNGAIQSLDNPNETDLAVTRSPTLRDLVQPNGDSNGGFFHTAFSEDLLDVLNHYDDLPSQIGNNNLDPRLRPMGNIRQLNMTEDEKIAVVAFLKTLSGTNVYFDEKWSNPF